MEPLKVLVIAVGLAMDAFTVSVAEGIALRSVSIGHMLRVAVCFGLFQALMPILGWLGGAAVRSSVAAYDHWIAFALLAFIGGKMVADAALGFETGTPRPPTRGVRLLALGLVTSIDALAVGVGLAMLKVRVWMPALVIGLVTGTMCAVGIQLGDRVGRRFQRWAEVVGGLILCGLGLTILIEHLVMHR